MPDIPPPKVVKRSRPGVLKLILIRLLLNSRSDSYESSPWKVNDANDNPTPAVVRNMAGRLWLCSAVSIENICALTLVDVRQRRVMVGKERKNFPLLDGLKINK